MARRPGVFVHGVSMEEGRKLQRITRTAKDPVTLRRAIVVLMSGQSQAVRDITSLMQVGEDYMRDVIYAFSERVFAALDPKWTPLANCGPLPSGSGPQCRKVGSSGCGQRCVVPPGVEAVEVDTCRGE
ncbi:hypothetical protein [Umezawaea sp. Da 62-37]|uniref:hypothetical protein n=1 Tax=Umezawaea sp. Da 62-37 TaxID=3075927 RepID=UPI0028F72F87|nr:hypothetical protein [Umezawaea sp. Da 62-37]WNV92196.1 hypothetical protein RM788_44175 [Umezawaea sp. Da 62-37]